MGMMLVHVCFKVSCEIADDAFSEILDQVGGDPWVVSEGGNTAHILVPFTRGAAMLAHQARGALSHSLVSDFAIVSALGLTYFEPGEEEDANEYLTLGEWWSDNAPADARTPGFRRWGLLLDFEEERQDGSKALASIRRHLGPNHKAHWHGRESIFLTFWDGDARHFIETGPVAKAVRHSEFAGAYLFELANDFIADRLGSLSSWFAEDPSASDHFEARRGPPKARPDKSTRAA